MLTRSDPAESPCMQSCKGRIEKPSTTPSDTEEQQQQREGLSAASRLLPPETLNLVCGHLGKRDLFHCMLTNRRFANAAVPHLWRTREATSDEILEECLRTLWLIPPEPNESEPVDASASGSFTTDTSKEPGEDDNGGNTRAGSKTPPDALQSCSKSDICMDTTMDLDETARQPPVTLSSSSAIPTESRPPTIDHRRNQRPMFDYGSYLTELDASENVSASRTTPRMLCRFLSLAGRNLKSLRLGVYLGQGKADTIALYCPNLTSLDLSRTFDPSGHEEATAYISHLLVEPTPELEHLSLLGLPLAAHVLGLACRAFPNLRDFAFGPPTDPDGEYGPLAETIPPRLYRLHARVPLPLRSDFLPHLGRRCPNLHELTFEEHARGNIPPYAWVHHCEATHIAVTGCATAFLRLTRISIYLSVLDLEAVLGRLSASCPNLEAVDIRVGVAIKDYFKRPSHFFSKLREITYTFEPASAPGLNQVLLHCTGLKQLTLATVGHGFDTDLEPRDETMDEQRSNTRVASSDDGLGKYMGANAFGGVGSPRASMRSGGSGLVTEMDLINGTHRMNHAGSGFGGGTINFFSSADASTSTSTVRQLMDRAPTLPPGWSARIVSTCKPSLRELRLRNCSGVTLFDLVCICRCTKLRRIEALRIWMPSSDAAALAESPKRVDWIRRHVFRAGNGSWPPTVVVSFLVTGSKIQQLAALSLSLPLPGSTVPAPPILPSVPLPLALPDPIISTESADWEDMYSSASSEDEEGRAEIGQHFSPLVDGSLSSSPASLLPSVPAHVNPMDASSSKRNKDGGKRRGMDGNAKGEGGLSRNAPRTGLPAPIPTSLQNGTAGRSNPKASPQQQHHHPQQPQIQQTQQQQHKYHPVNRKRSD